MIKFALIPVTIATAAGAQILMKYATSLNSIDHLPLINILKIWQIYVSVGLYGLTFVMTAYLYSLFELSFISPILVGGVMLLIFATGIYWGETVTLTRVFGGLFLVVGISLLSYSQ